MQIRLLALASVAILAIPGPFSRAETKPAPQVMPQNKELKFGRYDIVLKESAPTAQGRYEAEINVLLGDKTTGHLTYAVDNSAGGRAGFNILDKQLTDDTFSVAKLGMAARGPRLALVTLDGKLFDLPAEEVHQDKTQGRLVFFSNSHDGQAPEFAIFGQKERDLLARGEDDAHKKIFLKAVDYAFYRDRLSGDYYALATNAPHGAHVVRINMKSGHASAVNSHPEMKALSPLEKMPESALKGKELR